MEQQASAPPDAMPANIALSALTRAPFSLVVTNPALEDNPIVYVNEAFERVTGYSSAAAVGRNCRFLQGEGTDPNEVQKLRDAIMDGREISVDLLNYRANGDPFWNRLLISPLRTDEGGVAYFMGVQMALDPAPHARVTKEADDKVEAALMEIQHRVKNHLSMIVSMIRLQARSATHSPEADFKTLARRVETLQLLYQEMSDEKPGQLKINESIALGAYLSRVANAIAYLDGRTGVRVNVDADAISVPFEIATRLGLVLSEVMTNALQHAFIDRDSGLVEVRVKELSIGVMRVQISDDGNGIPESVNWPEEGNLGGRIVKGLVRGLDAKISVERAVSGTIVTLDVPAPM